MDEQEWFYRYEDAYNSEEKPYLLKFRVLRHTPRGVMIHEYGREKFVLAGVNGKRYAYPTEEDALRSYLARKRRAIAILQHSLHKQQRMLYRAELGQLERDDFFSAVRA